MRTVFEEELAQLDAQLLVMASAIEGALRGALDSLRARDAQAAAEIVRGDADINRMERDIEGLCLRIMLTQQPVAHDLRIVSAALRMVADMERIGDQAADIAEIAVQLEDGIDAHTFAHLEAMGAHASDMLHAAIASFVARDAAAAREVMAMDAQVDADFARLKADIVDGIRNAADAPEVLADALMMAKYLERIGDHAENIAEWVEYAVTGHYKGTVIS